MGFVRKMSTIADPALEDDSGFVRGIAASERPSATLSSHAAKRAGSSSFVPLRDLDKPQVAHTDAPLRDAGDGKLAIADVANGAFEPIWGTETKPRSQREIFLAEQAFVQGKQQGEEETEKRAHARGLQEGRESGYKQGFQDGEKERIGELEKHAEELAQQITDKRIETIVEFLEKLTQREKEASHKRDIELMALMIAIFDKTLPALAQENGEKEVQFFLKAILQRFENIPQITITLAEGAQEFAELLRERVFACNKSLVSFRFDPSFAIADCRIAWAEGEVERRFLSLWQEVKQALQQHLPTPTAASSEAETTETVEATETAEKKATETQDGASEHHKEAAA